MKIKLRDKNLKRKSNSGQAMLVAILVIFVAVIAIGLTAASIALSQSQIVQNKKLADQSYNLAVAGIENTLMRMTRGDFTNPAPLSQGTNSCTISISGSTPSYQILAVAENTSLISGAKKVTKKIQVDVTINNGVTTVTNFQEVY